MNIHCYFFGTFFLSRGGGGGVDGVGGGVDVGVLLRVGSNKCVKRPKFTTLYKT